MIQKKISVVVCCYYDALAIKALYERLSKVLASLTSDYEIIYVNDASPDNSEQILRELALHDKNLVVVNHSRNFGAQAAFTSGMMQATGDAVVLMDGDLQDPPELIVEFVKKWEEGNKVVYSIRRSREKSMGKVKEYLYHQFYVIFNRSAYITVPLDAGDFSLMDRVVVDHINSLPERDRFIRGLRAWVGYSSTGVAYTRPERFDGRPSVSTKGYIGALRWAKKAIFSFSFRPLELVNVLTALTTLAALAASAFYFISSFINPGPPGFGTLIIVVLLVSAVQLLSISIIGEYIIRIFEETKQRPRYIIRDIINNNKK